MPVMEVIQNEARETLESLLNEHSVIRAGGRTIVGHDGPIWLKFSSDYVVPPPKVNGWYRREVLSAIVYMDRSRLGNLTQDIRALVDSALNGEELVNPTAWHVARYAFPNDLSLTLQLAVVLETISELKMPRNLEVLVAQVILGQVA